MTASSVDVHSHRELPSPSPPREFLVRAPTAFMSGYDKDHAILVNAVVPYPDHILPHVLADLGASPKANLDQKVLHTVLLLHVKGQGAAGECSGVGC